jgi:hypothetical protein
MVVVVLLLWAYDDRAACAAPKKPPEIQQRVRTIRFTGGDAGSHRFEPYHFEEAK